MGGGTYSSLDRGTRATKLGYMTNTIAQTFKSTSINNSMNPHGVTVRESRDSEEHPNSVAIILALDVTGSMGSVPEHLVKTGLPHIMQSILDSGIPDPQMLFLAIGDHECDDAPLQVGQFESSDELLDKWLTSVYLESGGGGNAGESYMLAWYFAAKHTNVDCFEKRKKKGFLFTIGDEPVLKSIPEHYLKGIMGPGQYEKDWTAVELLDKAREMYNVYHLHIKQTGSGRRQYVIDGWKQMMGDNLIVIQSADHVSAEIAKIISDVEGTSESQTDTETIDAPPDTELEDIPKKTPDNELEDEPEEML